MKQRSPTEARAQLSTLVADVDDGKGPVVIAKRSKIKAVLVNAEWHSGVEEKLAHYCNDAKHAPPKLRSSMKIAGDVGQALVELKEEREKSLERLRSRLK